MHTPHLRTMSCCAALATSLLFFAGCEEEFSLADEVHNVQYSIQCTNPEAELYVVSNLLRNDEKELYTTAKHSDNIDTKEFQIQIVATSTKKNNEIEINLKVDGRPVKYLKGSPPIELKYCLKYDSKCPECKKARNKK